MHPRLILPAGFSALCTDLPTWVLRDGYGIVGFDPTAQTIRWRLQLPWSQHSSNPTMHRFGDRLVTSILRRAGDEEQALVFSLDPAEGTVDWTLTCAPEAIRRRVDRGGILPLGPDRFFLSDPVARTCRTHDAATGKVLAEHAFFPMRSFWPIGDRWLMWLYDFGTDRNEVVIADFSGEAVSLSPTVARGGLGDTIAVGETIWWNRIDPKTDAPAVFGSQPPYRRIDHTIPVPDGPRYHSTLRHTEQADHLWLYGAESLARIDLTAGAVVWSRVVPTETEPAWADGAIILNEQRDPVTDDADYTGRISWLDPATGDTRAVLEVPLPLEREITAVPGGLLANMSYLPSAFEDSEEWSPTRSGSSLLLTPEPPADPVHLIDDAPEVPILSRMVFDTTEIEAKLDAFKAAMKAGRDTGKWRKPAATIKALLGLKSVKRPVLAALKALPAEQSRVWTWAALFGGGPTDLIVPVVITKTRSSGEYTLLDLRSGRTATTHHDNLDEFGGEHRALLEDRPLTFLDRFFAQYG